MTRWRALRSYGTLLAFYCVGPLIGVSHRRCSPFSQHTSLVTGEANFPLPILDPKSKLHFIPLAASSRDSFEYTTWIALRCKLLSAWPPSLARGQPTSESSCSRSHRCVIRWGHIFLCFPADPGLIADYLLATVQDT